MFKTQLCKSIRILLVSLTACGCALAQYGGGGGMGGGTTGTGGYSSTSHSYGHGAVIGAVAGAGAGATILYLALHHRRQVIGCIGPDGKTLTTDKDKHTYQLAGAQMTAGEHLSVIGKKLKNDTGIDELEVKSVKKDLGQCEQQAGLVEQHE
jgi:hypothetical protein